MDRLSGLDASFFYVETPSCHMHVVGALVVDPSTATHGYDFERIVEGFEARLHLIPTFRKRVHMVPFGLDHPVWEDDPDFDLRRHFHHVAVPAPGTKRELAALVADIASHPLDRRKPLWEVWVIDGLEGGKVSVVTKVHHSIMDGVAGASVMAHLLDLSPDQPDPEKHAWHPESPAWDTGLFIRGLWSSSSRIGAGDVSEVASDLAGSVWTAMRHALAPDDRVRRSRRRGPEDHQASVRHDAERRRPRSLHPEPPSLPRKPRRRSRTTPDRRHPVAVRGKEDADKTDNQISTMFVRLPVDLPDPVDQLRTMVQFTPPRLVESGMRVYSDMKLADRHPPALNLVVSNVPGTPFPLYANGATVEAMYPMGPIMDGGALNLTVITYRDRVDFGALGCTELVPEIDQIADGFETAVQTLLDCAKLEQPTDAPQ